MKQNPLFGNRLKTLKKQNPDNFVGVSFAEEEGFEPPEV